MTRRLPLLTALPLAAWERDGVAAALRKAGLPADDIAAPERLVWRFEAEDGTPVGFGGLDLFRPDALLRSLVVLPPLRGRGCGAAAVAMLETEARAHHCRTVYVATAAAGDFFAGLGWRYRKRDAVPAAMQAATPFTGVQGHDPDILMKAV